MRTILITGSEGFIGRNLMATLRQQKDVGLIGFDIDDDPAILPDLLEQVDFVYHLAGVNRPQDPEEFQAGNADLTKRICRHLAQLDRCVPLALTSSTQAALENPYGVSKRKAENAAFAYRQRTGAVVYVFRLANVFGKWCRPGYNSGIATFCHNIARDLPIHVSDPSIVLNLMYVNDVVRALVALLEARVLEQDGFCAVRPMHTITLGEVVELIRSFRTSREQRVVPDMSRAFVKALYGTYVSYLPTDGFGYALDMHVDGRGSFTEFLRTTDRGQVSVNVARPGVTKGNHWHHSKSEKFLVVSGLGVISLRRVGSHKVVEYEVGGEKLEVIDIPTGYTHNIKNVGATDLVTVTWCSEVFDPESPDTFCEPVGSADV